MNRILTAILLACTALAAQADQAPLRVGPWQKIYTPPQRDGSAWWMNDHSFARDPQGRWHLFGITAPQPDNPLLATLFDDKALAEMDAAPLADILAQAEALRRGPTPIQTDLERQFAHASTDGEPLTGNWKSLEFALQARDDLGETVLWAPHVIYSEGLYYMFYCGGGADKTRFGIRLAVSEDLQDWQRIGDTPLFEDGYEARDPMVIRHGQQWIMYYTATSAPTGGQHIVAYRTSQDLKQWSERGIAFTDPRQGTGGGPTESPFVVERKGRYYLFLAMRQGYIPGHYRNTEVFVSDSPYHWSADQPVARINAHAAELIRVTKDRWYISHSGWYQGGVYLAPLEWLD